MSADDIGHDRRITLDDGRTLCWRELGVPNGFPLIALHGTPGSRWKFASGDAAARTHGLRLISLDRWGYGGTSPHPRPSFAHFGDEVGTLADRLGLDRIAVVGVSGGGPFAAAVAARLGKRVAALALVSPVGPMNGVRPWRDVSAFHWACFRVLPYVPGAVALPFTVLRFLSERTPTLAIKLVSMRAGRSDRVLLAETDLSQALAQTFATGLAPGPLGAVTDMRLFAKPWDIDPKAAHCAARLWLGTQDRNVPLSPARRLAAQFGAHEIMLEGHGHYWLSRNCATVFEWIATCTGPVST